MANVTVTFRHMLPEEELLNYLRTACRQVGGRGRWAIAVEPIGDVTRIEVTRHHPDGAERIVAEDKDPFRAAQAACAHFDSATAAA